MTTRTIPTRWLGRMLEGAFTALLWLAVLLLVVADHQLHQLACLGFAAVTFAILIVLALPAAWVRVGIDAQENHPHHPPRRNDDEPGL